MHHGLNRVRCFAATLFGVAVLGAGAAAALDFRSGERVDSTGAFTDSLFVAGRELTLGLTSTDDVFAAGRNVRVRDLRADHLMMAGAVATFEGGEAHDILAAAGEARFDGGGTQDDLIAAGGKILLGRGFRVGGSAVLSGGEVDIEGPVRGALIASGGTVRLDSVVAASAELAGDRIVIGPNARIGGDLAYRAKAIEISPEAVIAGRTVVREPRQPGAPQRLLGAVIAGSAVALLVFVVGGAVLVLAAAAAFPWLMDRAAGRMERRPLATLGLGFLMMVLAPALIIGLFVSLVGAPLALMVIALYLALAPLALASAVYALGMRGRRLAARGRPLESAGGWARFGWSLLAILALCLLGAIPILGGVLWLLAYALGLGAVAVEGRRALAKG